MRLALSTVVLAASVLVVAATPGAVTAQPQRRLVVIGDSVVMGAESVLVGEFRARGWQVDFDATVSRSTLAGIDAVGAHRDRLTDTLVVSLGANDGGSADTFRRRAQSLLDRVRDVPHVLWLSIHEVRDYYVDANRVLREVAAEHPNVSVVDWHAVAAGAPELTAADGLHLTGAGATALTDVLAAAVDATTAATTAVPTTAVPPTTAGATTAVPTTAPVTTVGAARVDDPTSTAAEREAPPPTTAVVLPGRDIDERAAGSAERSDPGTGGGWIGTAGRTIGGGLALVVACLVVAGVILGGWALVSTRNPPAHTSRSPNHPAMRARQRAERIAAARQAAHAGTPIDTHDTQQS